MRDDDPLKYFPGYAEACAKAEPNNLVPEPARALLKLAIELAEELRNRCDDPIHDEQIASLRALETQWAGSGQIVVFSDPAP